jgi:N-acyl-L-homoserine lactone synthetase
MVTVVSHENRPAYDAELSAMHRHRKQIFVDTLKWDVPVINGQFEIDQFDTDAAVYLMALDPATGAHLGSVRLLPSTGRHLLGDLFPHLCDGDVPVGEDIWEITRLCTAPGVIDPRTVRRHLAIALMEFGLLYGVRQYTSVAHMAWLSQVLAAGWDCVPLGLPQTVGGDPVGAVAINVTPAALQLFRQNLGLRQPLLRLPAQARAA